MAAKKYWDLLDTAGRAALALKCGSSVQYLYLIFSGHKVSGPRLAVKIEEATDGKVKRTDLRPDIFGPEPRRRAA